MAPLARDILLGVTPVAPGFGRVALDPFASLGVAFTAEVPTPLGPIKVERQPDGEPVRYSLPRGLGPIGRASPTAWRSSGRDRRRGQHALGRFG